MAYDGLVNYSVANELKTKIINGKIDKIYEPNFEEIILGIYYNGAKYALNLTTNAKYYRANLTTNTKTNPTFAPNFCMTLRKYLLGTHITNIYTKNLERIIFIELEGFNKSKDFSTKKLIVELMGKHSNIILVDNEDVIIDALKHFSLDSGSYRNIYAGSKYALPKSEKLDFMDIKDEEEFYHVLENRAKIDVKQSLDTDKVKKHIGSDLNIPHVQTLSGLISNTFTGISKNSILAFENELSIADNFEMNSSHLLFKYISSIIKNTNHSICFNYKNDYALKYCDFKENDLQINFFLDDYYTQKETASTFIMYRDNLLKLILGKLKKLNIKLDSINDKVQECKDAEKYKLYGELITSNLYRISDYNTNSITLENYYDNNNPITIALDSSISPSSNAKKFFKKYKKLKTAKEFVDEQKLSLENEINYLESIIYEIDSANTIMDIDDIYAEIQETNVSLSKKQKGNSNNSSKNSHKKSNVSSKRNYGEPLKFEIDGFAVLVGKNNKQNDYLTTKLANKEDLWFHVKDFHGSHVILRTDNKEPSQETLNKCARLAKEYSKASNSSNVPVDYTYVKYVKKPSSSKPGMVIYTNNKTVNV